MCARFLFCWYTKGHQFLASLQMVEEVSCSLLEVKFKDFPQSCTESSKILKIDYNYFKLFAKTALNLFYLIFLKVKAF